GLRVGDSLAQSVRLDPSQLEVPARLLSRPLELRAGDHPDGLDLAGYLVAAGYREAGRPPVGPGEFARDATRWWIGWRPFPGRLVPGSRERILPVILRLDAEGRIEAVETLEGSERDGLLLEPALFSRLGRTLREPMPLHELPTHLVDAVLAIEDHRFFRHAGLDPMRIGGALLANLRAGRIVEGGSTLTQQLMKNRFLTRERLLSRKLRDAAMALRVEGRHPKGEILETYLNEIYLGQRGRLAIHGVGAGAWHHVGKPVGELDIAEAALLAALISGPSRYAPARHPERARARRDLVLRRMTHLGMLTPDELTTALAARLPKAGKVPTERAGYFSEWIRPELEWQFGAGALERDGLSIVTSLDWRLQGLAEQAVREGLDALQAERPELRGIGSPLQAALVALDPQRGEVLAWVGGRDAKRFPFDRAHRARRQPGSVFKPVVALAAISQAGQAITLETRLRDAPYRVSRPEGWWEPTNYDGRFHGVVSLAEALERSLNVPMARLAGRVGLARVVAMARRLGIESPLEPVPSLALGASELGVLEVTRAYAVLAADGIRAELRRVPMVLDREGEVLQIEPLRGKRVVAAAAARELTRALRGVVERGTARRLRALGVRGPLAAKTGTTNDYRDSWLVAYTPSLVVGVWVGFDDGRSTGLPGSRGALPVAARFLAPALAARATGSFAPETAPRPLHSIRTTTTSSIWQPQASQLR
ncbi:MAG: transglycosylase domain-containing protein, partial [Deltaproteobacteria bacterium]|nr:transglycosylase domain-containing protein [Deltaproteobacteria bacterium]